MAILAGLALAACGGGGSSGGGGPPPGGNNGLTIGGTVSGLGSGKTVALQVNGDEAVSVSQNRAYAFPTSVSSGFAYAVAVLIQPVGQTCAVSNPSGTVSGNVGNIAVTCTSSSYSIGGTVTGLTGSGALLNNGANALSLANGPFTFSAQLPDGAPYAVTATVQGGQTCTVNNGRGTVSAGAVTNVAVICNASAFAVGGTLSGLTGTLVLQNNGGDDATLGPSDTGFAFPAPVADGARYSVTVLTQPAGQGCSVALGTGAIAGAGVTNVDVTCADNAFTVGGAVSGLSGTLVLRNNNGDDTSLSTNGPFSFPLALVSGSTYSVTVQTKPAAQTCLVGNSSGAVNANVGGVAVSCGVPDLFPVNATFVQNAGVGNALFATVGVGNAGTVASGSTTTSVQFFADDSCATAPAGSLSAGIGPLAPGAVISAVTSGGMIPPGTYLSQLLTVAATADETVTANNTLCRQGSLAVH